MYVPERQHTLVWTVLDDKPETVTFPPVKTAVLRQGPQPFLTCVIMWMFSSAGKQSESASLVENILTVLSLMQVVGQSGGQTA